MERSKSTNNYEGHFNPPHMRSNPASGGQTGRGMAGASAEPNHKYAPGGSDLMDMHMLPSRRKVPQPAAHNPNKS